MEYRSKSSNIYCDDRAHRDLSVIIIIDYVQRYIFLALCKS